MPIDILNKILKKQAVAPAQDKAAETVSAKKQTQAKPAKKGFDSETKIKIAIGAVFIIIFFAMSGSMDSEEEGDSELIVPLAELTGQVGVKPKKETLEQQFRRENKNVPLSDGSTIPAQVVNERTHLFRQVPFGDEELAYEMRLPSNWIQSKFGSYGAPSGEQYNVMTNIDRYFGPAIGDQRPFVWLETERLERLTTAAYYRDLYFIKRGITPEAVRQDSDNRAEALYVEQRDYAIFAVRTLFVMNGDRMTIVTFGVPIEDYGTFRDIMGLTMASYKQLHVIERTPEKIESHKLLNVTTFDYPARWIVRNENRLSSMTPSLELVLPTELQIAMNQLGQRAEIEGLILVNVWRNTADFNREVMEKAIVKRLEQGHLRLSTVLQPEKTLPPRSDINEIKRSVYVGIVDPTIPTVEEFGIVRDDSAFPRQEVWVTTLNNGSYTAAVTLVTWPQTKEYRSWAYNVITYEKIVNTLKLRYLGL